LLARIPVDEFGVKVIKQRRSGLLMPIDVERVTRDDYTSGGCGDCVAELVEIATAMPRSPWCQSPSRAITDEEGVLEFWRDSTLCPDRPLAIDESDDDDVRDFTGPDVVRLQDIEAPRVRVFSTSRSLSGE
jgi:hypothetical protein